MQIRIVLGAGMVVAAAFMAVAATVDPQERTLAGQYQWSDGGSGELEAEFRPAGDQRWDVTFRFEFGGKRHRWEGTADGALEPGSDFNGTARWKRRTWRFEARVDEVGLVTGSHTETSGDREYRTGTFTLSE